MIFYFFEGLFNLDCRTSWPGLTTRLARREGRPTSTQGRADFAEPVFRWPLTPIIYFKEQARKRPTIGH